MADFLLKNVKFMGLGSGHTEQCCQPPSVAYPRYHPLNDDFVEANTECLSSGYA